jgi:hypothetical protein
MSWHLNIRISYCLWWLCALFCLQCDCVAHYSVFWLLMMCMFLPFYSEKPSIWSLSSILTDAFSGISLTVGWWKWYCAFLQMWPIPILMPLLHSYMLTFIHCAVTVFHWSTVTSLCCLMMHCWSLFCIVNDINVCFLFCLSVTDYCENNLSYC